MNLSSEESLRLQTSKEGQFFERKSAVDHSPGGPKARKPTEIAWDIAETMSAMANADGGELVVGMEDDGSITGVENKEKVLEFLRQVPTGRDYVSPSLPCRVNSWQTADGLVLLHFQVAWSPEVHSLTDSRCLLRRQDSNIPFDTRDVAALKELKTKGLYESTFPTEASLDDIDLPLAARLLKALDVTTVLRERYNLVEERSGRLVPCLAALLLFGKNPMKWHPRAYVDFTRFEGNERKFGSALNISKRFRVEFPLCELIPKAFDAIQPFIKERQRLHDLFFQEKLEYPTFAWQEAIVNAVAHRDYSLYGAPIEVWMFDDRMEIRSPGVPPAPVTVQTLSQRKKLHFSRNPLIVRVLTDLSLMREQGEGVPRMFEEMEKAGYYPPEFELIENAFLQVTLRNQPVYDDKTLEWLKIFDGVELSLEQKHLLALAHSRQDRFTSKDFQKLTKTDIYTASGVIKDMIRKGIVRQAQKGGRVYEIFKPLQAHSEMPEELIKLLPKIQRHGSISNQDIRNVLDISRPTATRVAADLCVKGWMTRDGPSRGRGVRYVLLERNESASNFPK